jgi:short-subunit dehydrogenase involved in D-alanine esterification of teichoic acids
MASIADKTILITGGNRGIGRLWSSKVLMIAPGSAIARRVT